MGTKIPTRHNVRGELFGSLDEYDDVTLRVASRVVVLFPSDRYNNGVIVCGLRNNSSKMSHDLGAFHETRFNKTTQTVDKDGHWTLKLDQGEFLKVDKSKITFDNSTGEQIIFDKKAKTIFLNAGKDWIIKLGNNAQLTAANSVLINCKNATVTASENVTINAAKRLIAACENADVTAKAKVTVKCSDAEVNASGKIKLQGGTIDMNQALSPITTEDSHLDVIDLITNVPVVGVKQIKAG